VFPAEPSSASSTDDEIDINESHNDTGFLKRESNVNTS